MAGLAGSNSLFAGHAVLHFFGYPHGYWMGIWLSEDSRWRPYRDEYTRSLQNSEVNRRRARIVLRWGTAREVLRVLPALLPFSPVSTGLPLLRRPVSTVAILAQGTYSWLATRSPFFVESSIGVSVSGVPGGLGFKWWGGGNRRRKAASRCIFKTLNQGPVELSMRIQMTAI